MICAIRCPVLFWYDSTWFEKEAAIEMAIWRSNSLLMICTVNWQACFGMLTRRDEDWTRCASRVSTPRLSCPVNILLSSRKVICTDVNLYLSEFYGKKITRAQAVPKLVKSGNRFDCCDLKKSGGTYDMFCPEDKKTGKLGFPLRLRSEKQSRNGFFKVAENVNQETFLKKLLRLTVTNCLYQNQRHFILPQIIAEQNWWWINFLW